jgi:hypothetical protein
MKSALFWDITQRWVVVLYRRFGTTCRSHLQELRSPRRKPSSLTSWTFWDNLSGPIFKGQEIQEENLLLGRFGSTYWSPLQGSRSPRRKPSSLTSWTFRDNLSGPIFKRQEVQEESPLERWVVVLYRRFGTTYRSHLQGSRSPRSSWASWPLKMGPKPVGPQGRSRHFEKGPRPCQVSKPDVQPVAQSLYRRAIPTFITAWKVYIKHSSKSWILHATQGGTFCVFMQPHIKTCVCSKWTSQTTAYVKSQIQYSVRRYTCKQPGDGNSTLWPHNHDTWHVSDPVPPAFTTPRPSSLPSISNLSLRSLYFKILQVRIFQQNSHVPFPYLRFV